MKRMKSSHRSILASVTALMLATALWAAAAPSGILAAAGTAATASADAAADTYSDGNTVPDSSATVPVYEEPVPEPQPSPAPEAAPAAAPASSLTPRDAKPAVGGGGAAIPVPAAADTTAPVFGSLTPADGSLIGPAATFSASFSDPEPSVGINQNTIMLHIDNRHQFGCAITSTSITCNKSGLKDGPHKLEAFACDTNFNCNTATWRVTVDAVAPAISGNHPTGTINTRGTTLAAAFSDSGSGVDPATVVVTVDGTPASGCSAAASGVSCPVSGLSDGDHSAHVEVADRLGNRATQTWTFSVDAGSIGVSGHSPADGAWLADSAPQVKVDFTAAGSGVIDPSGVTLLIDGVDVSAGADCQSAGISYTPASPRLADGWHTVTVTVRDSAGHTGTSTWTFGVDTTPPGIGGAGPTGTVDAKPQISAGFSDSGSGVDPLSVVMILDGQEITSAATIDAAGITFVPGEAMVPGAHGVQLSVADQAGNRQTASWSFETAAAPAEADPDPDPNPVPAFIPPAATPGTPPTMTEYWMNDGPIAIISNGGTWSISGFPASANVYYLPWYESGSAQSVAAPVPGDEINIRNAGAGEAVVNIFVGSDRHWEGKIPEGGAETARLEGVSGGPVKIVCPSGQALEVTRRIKNPDGSAAETRAVPEEDLEAELLLPAYETPPAAEGRSLLVIANPSLQEAAVDVYVGDPAIPESLKGQYTIGSGTAARTELPGVSGGPVRIVCRNGQPLVAGIDAERRQEQGGPAGSTGVRRAGILATGLSRLESFYVMERKDGQTGKAPSRLLVANPNDFDIAVELKVGGETVNDPDDQDSDRLQIPGEGLKILDLAALPAGTIEISCGQCGLGEGILATAGD